MGSDLRKSILEADDIGEEILDVPEWGTKLLIKGMNGKERANFLKRSMNIDGEVAFDRFYPELVIATAHDPESGDKIFEAADRDPLNTKSGAALERIATVAQRLSGLGSSDVEVVKGNSASSQSNAST